MRNVKPRSRKEWSVWFFPFSLFVLAILFYPTWPHSYAWGYYPFAGVGLVFVFFILLLFVGTFGLAERSDQRE